MILTRARYDNNKLFSANPAAMSDGSKMRLHHLAHLIEDHITRVMAVVIIEQLEVIHIDRDQSQLPVVTSGDGQLLVGGFKKSAPFQRPVSAARVD